MIVFHSYLGSLHITFYFLSQYIYFVTEKHEPSTTPAIGQVGVLLTVLPMRYCSHF
jgi:hypothetical protein